MSKRIIHVAIDANAKTCGRCEFWIWENHFCIVFCDDADNRARCPACLAAEKEAHR